MRLGFAKTSNYLSPHPRFMIDCFYFLPKFLIGGYMIARPELTLLPPPAFCALAVEHFTKSCCLTSHVLE